MSSVSALNSLVSSTTTSSSAIDLSSILASETGTSAGIDVTSAVNAGIYAARAPERLWQAQQTDLTSQTTALNTLETATTSLDNDMQSLNSLSGPLSARTVSSSDSTLVTGSAAASTAMKNHTVVVNNLAQTASWYTDSVVSATTALPPGSFTITPTGTSTTEKPLTVTIGNGVNDLTDVANYINNSSANPGVTAEVVTDTTGSRLAIVSNGSGTAANFTVATSTAYPMTSTSWSSASVANATTPIQAGTFTLSGPSGSA
jgi:flagellar hook-associated protein 2